MIENIIKLILLILLGIIFGQVRELCISLLAFVLLRVHAGGIHSKTSLGCTFAMVIMECVTLVVHRFWKLPFVLVFVLIIIDNLSILFCAPNGNQSCEMLDNDMKKRKKFFAVLTLNILFLLAKFTDWKEILVVPTTCEAISLLAYEINRKEAILYLKSNKTLEGESDT